MMNKANIKKIILEDGTIFHFQNHVLHRNKGPAVIYPDGTKEWWFNGRRHRSELFAIITSFGKDIKIRNGKVIMKYWDDINDDLIIETYDEKHVEYIERTYKILSSIPLRILQLPHSETIDTTEKDTIKIYSFGIAHSVIGPSEIKKNGTRVYYQFGVKHCEHSPAIIDSVTNSEYWYRYGMLHREDGPAITKTDESSITYSYFKHGVSERIDGPAEIVYKTKFKKNILEIWMKQGRLHRTLDFNNSEGPAMKITHICPDTEKIGEIYFAHFREGELYNLNGPASYCIDNGRKRFEDYFINEEKVEKEKFIKIMRHVKLFTKKIMTPKRKKLSKCLYKHLTFFCKDLCNEISEFVL
jgi:hypothetical protein